MIVVTGELRFAEGKDEAVRAALLDMMAETAKEAGCLYYRFYRDVERPEVYRVYEEWESEAALAAHAASAHMQLFRARREEIGLVSRRAKKMEVGATTEI